VAVEVVVMRVASFFPFQTTHEQPFNKDRRRKILSLFRHLRLDVMRISASAVWITYCGTHQIGTYI
jgi:hypothetical protein